MILKCKHRLKYLALQMQHPDIYGVLLELADHCDVPDVRANGVQLLNCLPTHSQVLDSIRAALQGPQAAQDLESLLCQSQAVAVAPTRLLYTLQVCKHITRLTKCNNGCQHAQTSRYYAMQLIRSQTILVQMHRNFLYTTMLSHSGVIPKSSLLAG